MVCYLSYLCLTLLFQGRTNNLAHPCLGEICINFFYTGKNALAHVFPEDFRKQIPDHALALVATAVSLLSFYLFIVLIMSQMRHCLQRYATGIYIDYKFEGVIQSSVYSRMITLIDEIKSNPYHKAKYINNCRRWAKMGMQVIIFYFYSVYLLFTLGNFFSLKPKLENMIWRLSQISLIVCFGTMLK